MQKTQFAKGISWRSFVKRKQKKPLFCVVFGASFIVYMITLVSYYRVCAPDIIKFSNPKLKSH